MLSYSDQLYEYAISDSLAKKAEALQAFTGFRQFSEETIQKFNQYKVVDHLIGDLHQDLVPKFVNFMIKLWNYGEFKEQDLQHFWNVCINEHVSVIDKFFACWPKLYDNIPKDKLSVFWEIIFNTKKFPKAALDFLFKISTKVDDVTKSKLITVLSNSEARLDCVDTIYEMAKSSSTISNAIARLSIDKLKEDDDPKFRILLLQKLIKYLTVDDLHIILEHGKLDPDDTEPLLNLINLLCRAQAYTMNQDDLDKVKDIIKPIMNKNPQLVTQFLNKLITHRTIGNSLITDLLQWLVSQKTVMADFIFKLFLQINNINNNNSIDNLNFVGINSIFNILYSSDDPIVAEHFTNLIMRIKSNSVIDNIIVQIMENQMSNASLLVLYNLIYQNEMILIDPPKCNKFEYSPPITIKLTDKGTIKIPFGSSVDFFKRRVGSYLNTDFTQLQYFLKDDPLTDNHHFFNNEEITVKSPIFGSGFRKWGKTEYPTYILSKYSNKLFEIVKSNTKESENALAVLNMLPTIECEEDTFKSKTPNWEEIIDPKYPYVLLYRMNILSHIIDVKNRRDITNIFKTHGFKCLMKLIIDNKSIFSRTEHVDLFSCAVGMLVVSSSTIVEAIDSKLETYKSLGHKSLIDSLLGWIVGVPKIERTYSLMVKNIVFLICDIAKYDPVPLIENANFTDIFVSTIFDHRLYIQEAFANVIMLSDLKKIEKTVLAFVELARLGNCSSYFKIIKKIAEITDDPLTVWNRLAKGLMDNLFIMSPNAILPDNFGHEQLYPESFIKKNAKNSSSGKKSDSKKQSDSQSSSIKQPENKSTDAKQSDTENKSSNTKQPDTENKSTDAKVVDSENNENSTKQSETETKLDNENKSEAKTDKQTEQENTKDEKQGDTKSEVNNENEKDKRPTIFAENKENKKGVKPVKKEKVRYLNPGIHFTVEELREAALVMSADVADPLFVSCIFEVLLILIPRLENPFPYAEELCIFAINKIAFNVSRIIPAPRDLFNLIIAIIKKDNSVGNQVFQRLTVLHKRYDPKYDTKQEAKLSFDVHKGLRNLGCTCYINASLQQLLRVPEVRDTILGYIPSDGNIQNDWLAELQQLFVKLLYFPCAYIDPWRFISKFKTTDGRAIDVREQQDAMEFIESVMAQIDEKIPGKPIETLLHGKIIHEIVPLDSTIEYHGETFEKFQVFPLEVRDINNISDSFKLFRVPDTFTGKNKYNTEKDVGLIDAQRLHAVIDAPDTFIFQLKRFDFDFYTMTRTKIHTPFVFPEVLDIAPILKSGESTIYNLSGIVMHSGNSEGGHYISYAKDKDGWFVYNDHHVTQVDSKYIMERATAMKGGIFENMNLSAYLLFYRKENPSNPPVDPICKLPAQKVASLLEDIQAIVLRNVITSQTYQEFLRSVAMDARCMNAYFMVIDLLEVLLKNPQQMSKYYDELTRLMLTKINSDQMFADFIVESGVSYSHISEEYNETLRYTYSNLLQAAIRKSDKDHSLINKIRERLTNAFRSWKCLDTLFEAVNAYLVKHPDVTDSNLLNSFMMIPTQQFCKQPEEVKQKFLKEGNLSGCFRAVRILLERSSDESKQIYQSIIMDKDFLDDWFIGENHAFEFGCLVAFFYKGNEKLTKDIIEYVQSDIKKVPQKQLVAYFASFCTVNDEFTEQRLDLFFKTHMMQKCLNQSVHILADQLKYEGRSACAALMKYKKQWVYKWLSSDDDNIRKSCVSLIHSIFSDAPLLQKIPMSYGVAQGEMPHLSPETQILMCDLWDEMMECNKQIVTTCKSKGNAGIGTDYFRLLSWATYYSGKYAVVDRLYIALQNNIDQFSKLKEKSAICAVLDFLETFLGNQFAFFNESVFGSIVKAVGRLPKKDDNYIIYIISKFFPMISIVAPQFSQIVASSAIYAAAVKEYFDENNGEALLNFTKSILNKKTVGTISQIFFSSQTFDANLRSNNSIFFDAVYELFNHIEAIDVFVSSSIPEVVFSYLEELIVARINMKQILPLRILITATQKFISHHKNEQKLIGNPLGPIIDIWITKGELLEVLFQELIDSSTPIEVLREISDLIVVVYGNLDRFTTAGLNLIRASSMELYSMLEPTIRVTIATLRILLITRIAQTKQNHINLLIKDVRKLVESELYDSEVFVRYIKAILFHAKYNKDELANILTAFLTGTNDISSFVGDFVDAMKYCELTTDQQDATARRCMDLIVKYNVEDNSIKDDNVDKALNDMQIFLKYCACIEQIYNRKPVIMKREPYTQIQCNDERVKEKLKTIQEYQYL